MPIAFSGMTCCFGACFNSTFASAAALAAPKMVSSPANGTATPSSPAKMTATPPIATTAATSLRVTSASTWNPAASSAVVSGTVAKSTAEMPLGTDCSPLYRSVKLMPRLKKPHSAAPRSALPRGSGMRNAPAIANSSTDARVSRIVAAQTGGVASFPNRIARKVLPQMRAQATNVTAIRMRTT